MQQLLTLANKNLQKGKQIYKVTIESLFNFQTSGRYHCPLTFYLTKKFGNCKAKLFQATLYGFHHRVYLPAENRQDCFGHGVLKRLVMSCVFNFSYMNNMALIL